MERLKDYYFEAESSEWVEFEIAFEDLLPVVEFVVEPVRPGEPLMRRLVDKIVYGFTVTAGEGESHVVVIRLGFPPEAGAGAIYEVKVRGSEGVAYALPAVRRELGEREIKVVIKEP